MRRDEDLSSRVKCFPKTLFALSRCRIPNTKDFGDLLSCLSLHAGARFGEDYGGGAAARRGKTLTCLDVFVVEADG
jgi:hypothetical protein